MLEKLKERIKNMESNENKKQKRGLPIESKKQMVEKLTIQKYLNTYLILGLLIKN